MLKKSTLADTVADRPLAGLQESQSSQAAQDSALFFQCGDEDRREVFSSVCENLRRQFNLAELSEPVWFIGASDACANESIACDRNSESLSQLVRRAPTVFASVFIPKLVGLLRRTDCSDADVFQQIKDLCASSEGVTGEKRSEMLQEWASTVANLIKYADEYDLDNDDKVQNHVMDRLYRNECFKGGQKNSNKKQLLDNTGSNQAKWLCMKPEDEGNGHKNAQNGAFGFMHFVVQKPSEVNDCSSTSPGDEILLDASNCVGKSDYLSENCRFTLVHVVSQRGHGKEIRYGESLGALLLVHHPKDRVRLRTYRLSKEREDEEIMNDLAENQQEEVPYGHMQVNMCIRSLEAGNTADDWDNYPLVVEEDSMSFSEKTSEALKEEAKDLIIRSWETSIVQDQPRLAEKIQVCKIILQKIVLTLGSETKTETVLQPNAEVKNGMQLKGVEVRDKKGSVLQSSWWKDATKIVLRVFVTGLPVRRGGSEEKSEPLTPPTKCQQDVAQRILARVKFVFETQGKVLSDFRAVHYIILVPPQTTLFEQTKQRAAESLAFYYKHDLDWNFERMLSKKDDTNSEIKRLRELATEHKDVLWVMIVDESHWGITKDGVHNLWLNDEVLLRCENVMSLLVSATPYNNLTRDSRIPEKYVNLMEDGRSIESCIPVRKKLLCMNLPCFINDTCVGQGCLSG